MHQEPKNSCDSLYCPYSLDCGGMELNPQYLRAMPVFENFQTSLQILMKIIFQMELATSSLKPGLFANGNFIYCLSNNLKGMLHPESNF